MRLREALLLAAATALLAGACSRLTFVKPNAQRKGGERTPRAIARLPRCQQQRECDSGTGNPPRRDRQRQHGEQAGSAERHLLAPGQPGGGGDRQQAGETGQYPERL